MQRGDQPLTSAWALEEVMDVKPAIEEVQAEFDRAGNDGQYTPEELARVEAKLRRALAEAQQATLALAIAANDQRKAENVMRGGIVRAQALDEEAQLMAQADALHLDVPNAEYRNRQRMKTLPVIPFPAPDPAAPEAA